MTFSWMKKQQFRMDRRVTLNRVGWARLCALCGDNPYACQSPAFATTTEPPLITHPRGILLA
jgi:hypothetical protein